MSMPSSSLMSADVASSEMERLRKNIEDSSTDHNRAIIDMKTRLNALTRIARLPPELLSEIFLHHVAISGGSQRLYPYSWIRIAHVCRHWREVALHTPQLWNNITVVGKLDLMEELIARSRQAPLYVSIKSTRDRTSSVARVLQELHRIRSFEWISPRHMLPELTACFTGPATLLQTLIVTDHNARYEVRAPLPSLISELDSPRLEKLAIIDYNASWSSPIFRPTLKHMVLSTPPSRSTFSSTPSSITLSDVVRALESMPLLEHLYLRRVLSATVRPSETYQAERTVNLPRLTFLRIADVASQCLWLFEILLFSANATIMLDLYSCNGADESEMGDSITKKIAGVEASGSRQPLRSLAILPDNARYNRTKISGWTDVLSVADLGATSPHAPSISISLPGSMDSLRLSAKLPVAHVRALHVGDVPDRYMSTSDDTQSQWTHPLRVFIQLEALQLTGVDPGFMLLAFDSGLDNKFLKNATAESADAPLLFPQLSALTLESVRFRRVILDDNRLYHPDDLPEEEDYKSYAPAFRNVLLKRTKKNAAPMTLTLRTCINIENAEVDAFKDVVAELCWNGIDYWDDPDQFDDEFGNFGDEDGLEDEVQPEDLLEDFYGW